MFNINDSPTNARLMVLLIAPAQWLLFWCARFVDLLPIGVSLRAALVGLIAAIALLGTWIVQTAIYRAMTGIGVPAHDNYFFHNGRSPRFPVPWLSLSIRA